MSLPSLEEWNNVLLTLAVLTQAISSVGVWRVTVALRDLQRNQFVSQGPLFRVYFNGFQSQPRDPRSEMLSFQMTVVNEGRTDARIASYGLRVLDSEARDAEREQSFTLIPLERVKWGQNSYGGYGPQLPPPQLEPGTAGRDPRDDFFVLKNDARAYIAFLPANGGYEKWKRVRLHVEPVGGPEGSAEVPWDLFWLESHD